MLPSYFYRMNEIYNRTGSIHGICSHKRLLLLTYKAQYSKGFHKCDNVT